MGSAGQGAKAGLVAGIAFGVILASAAYFTLVANKSTIIADIASSMPTNINVITPEQEYNIALVLASAFAIILGLVGGLVLGAIYGKVFGRVPGRSSVIKGVIFGIVLRLLVSVLGAIGDYTSYGAIYYLLQIATGLVGALIFGVVLGYFYGKFGRPKGTYEMRVASRFQAADGALLVHEGVPSKVLKSRGHRSVPIL